MRKFLDLFCRVATGGLLIFSGTVKLIDPIGTQYKMEEYFEVFSESIASFFHAFIPYALEISFFMIVLEIVLGVAILLHWRMNLTMWVTLLMMLFFTFLTFYSAYFNKVTDCGCFGDFMKLKPWTTFTKDVVLDVLILHLFWYRKSYVPLFFGRPASIIMLSVTLLSVLFGMYSIYYLPLVDFRPYKIGNHIPTQMKPSEPPIFEYVFEKDGKKITSQKFLSAEEGYKYVDSHVLNEDKSKPKITDFSVSVLGGETITPTFFEGNKLLIIIWNVSKAEKTHTNEIKLLIDELKGKADAWILTASSQEEIEAYSKQAGWTVPVGYADAVVLKTIIRSNPGVALWKDGTVMGNWSLHALPSSSEVLPLLE